MGVYNDNWIEQFDTEYTEKGQKEHINTVKWNGQNVKRFRLKYINCQYLTQ